MNNIFVNDLLRQMDANDEFDGKISRVLWINNNHTKCYVINLEDKNALPILVEMDQLEEGLAEGKYVKENDFVMEQSWTRMTELESFEELEGKKRRQYEERLLKKKEELEKIYSIVAFITEDKEPDIYLESYRSMLIKDAMEKFGIKKYDTVLRYLRRFWQGGKTKSSLLPHFYNCGGPGKIKACSNKKRGRKRTNFDKEQLYGTNIDENKKNKIRYIIENGPKQLSLKQLHELMVSKYFSFKKVVNGEEKLELFPDEQIPSYEQFLYWANKEKDVVRDFQLKHGNKNYNLKGRALLSDSTLEVMGPGSRYQIDASSSDIYVVSELDPNRIIGKPTIYIIVDVFSRMICGIYVGMEENSWDGAMMALVNMVEDKVDFCKRYGVNIQEGEWPIKHIPHTIIADRGEFKGELPNNLIEGLGIALENTAPYRGDLKGIVEKTHDLIHQQYKSLLPGVVYKSMSERGENDPRKDAVITLKELTAIIIKIVLYLNNGRVISTYKLSKEMIRDNILAIPLNLWRWGIANVSGRLRGVNNEFLKFSILPSSKAQITKNGIKLNHLCYTCETAEKLNWFAKARIVEGWPIDVHYDRRDMSFIYFYDNKSKKIERCELTPSYKKYEGFSYDEIKKIFSLINKMPYQNKRNSLEMKINVNNAILSTLENAEKRKAILENNQSDSERLRSIRANKEEQKRINKSEEFFILGDEKPIDNQNEIEDEELIEAKEHKVDLIQQLYNEDEIEGEIN